MIAKVRPFVSVFLALVLALLYGLLARLYFANQKTLNPEQNLGAVVGTISLAFLVLVPIAIGVLTVFFAPPARRASIVYAIFMPWLSMFIAAVLAGVLAFEVAICIAMALPIMFLMASAGGIATWFIVTRAGRPQTQIIGALLLAPYLFAPLESMIPPSDSYHTVQTQIEINANEATVWQNIIRVSEIQPGERHFSMLFDVFGAPRPLEARLGSDGFAAMRQGIFQGQLKFNERITAWEPGHRLDFAIEAQNNSVPNPMVSLSPWHEIGGDIFSVPEAGYTLERLPNGHILLHLSSTHRLTSRFNDYGGMWTSWGMSEFQNQILQVIKARCEAL